MAQVAIFLGASVIAVPLFRKLQLSAILGYLAAGIAIGPSGFNLICDADASGVMSIGELGVVLLLFVIGLELQPARLRVMRCAVFGLGAAQMAVTTAAFTGLGLLCGLAAGTALIIGFAPSLSSTPLALQLLAERGQLTTQAGRSAFGILLFQDLAVMPVLALLPLLGAQMGDCKTLQLQRHVRDDEQQLIQTNELAMKELEKLFAADAEPEATGRE